MRRLERSHSETLDELELRVISDAHRAPLLGYLERMTGDHQLAGDLVQESLIRA